MRLVLNRPGGNGFMLWGMDFAHDGDYHVLRSKFENRKTCPQSERWAVEETIYAVTDEVLGTFPRKVFHQRIEKAKTGFEFWTKNLPAIVESARQVAERLGIQLEFGKFTVPRMDMNDYKVFAILVKEQLGLRIPRNQTVFFGPRKPIG